MRTYDAILRSFTSPTVMHTLNRNYKCSLSFSADLSPEYNNNDLVCVSDPVVGASRESTKDGPEPLGDELPADWMAFGASGRN